MKFWTIKLPASLAKIRKETLKENWNNYLYFLFFLLSFVFSSVMQVKANLVTPHTSIYICPSSYTIYYRNRGRHKSKVRDKDRGRQGNQTVMYNNLSNTNNNGVSKPNPTRHHYI